METIKYRAFLDTNILLDVLCTPDRPSAASSRLIFEAIRAGIFEGFLSTQSILDAAYILSRTASPYDRETFGRSILTIMEYINVNAIHFFDLRDAIVHGDGDLEDDAQFAHATAQGCDAIITSDRAFRHRKDVSSIPLYSPEEFVARLRG